MTMTIEEQRTPKLTYDIMLLFPVLLLVGIGIVMVYSASSALALKKFGSEYFFLKKQALFAAGGIVALVVYKYIPYRWYQLLAYPILLLALGFLIAILFSGWGTSAGGAARWLRLGPISFQPSEFARFAVVIFIAYSMNKKRERLEDFYIGFLPHVLVLSAFTVLIFLQPDFGSVMPQFRRETGGYVGFRAGAVAARRGCA